MSSLTYNLAGEIDYLVVGGGSSGCVIASRLSEDARLNVVLLEAGRAFEPDDEPAALRDVLPRAYLDQSLMWPGLFTIPHPDPGHPEGGVKMPYRHARILGGGSSVNGMNAQRGLPGDYDEWSDFGVVGWNWSDVEPFFRKLETDVDFDGDDHGHDGPIAIERIGYSQFSAFEIAVDEDWRQRKMGELADLNSVGEHGRSRVPLSIKDGRRCSTVRGYLPASVQNRSNLTIIGNMIVDRLMIEEGRVVGVTAVSKGERVRFKARHVVLTPGSFASPMLLHRAGIGDRDLLQQADIKPVLHRPGVGANMSNHPNLFLSAYLPPRSRVVGKRGMTAQAVRFASGLPGCGAADMFIQPLGMSPDATANNPLGRCIGSMLAIVQKPYSTGVVLPTREGPPRILGHQFADERDTQRLVLGFRIIREQLDSFRRQGVVGQIFVPTAYGRESDTWMTALFNKAAQLILDSGEFARRRLLARVGVPIEAVPTDNEALREWVMQFAFPGYHASGTCRMGREDDPMAVVDSRCRVIGITGLTIADASIFPTIMRAGTYIPSVMAGERIAAMIAEDRRHLDTRSTAIAA